MAPVKFEDDFKDKLEKRSIKPSSEAWEKLSQRLDAEEETSNTLPLRWIGLAASIVGISFFALHFWNNDIETIQNTPKVVVDESKEIENKRVFDSIQTNNQEVVSIEKEDIDKNERSPINSKIDVSVEIRNVETIELANNSNLEESTDKKEKQTAENSQQVLFEMATVQQVAKTINELSESNEDFSEADIDSLLKVAQRDIMLSRINNEDQITINASLLLQEAEYELDESFREKVFRTLKESYGTVKTAIARRNN